MKYLFRIIGIVLIVAIIFNYVKEGETIQNSGMRIVDNYNDQEKFEESLKDHQEIIDRVERKVRILSFFTPF